MKVKIVLAAAAIALAAGGGGVWAAASGAPLPPNPAPPSVPGTDGHVQQWFEDRDALVIDLNNTLLTVQGADQRSAKVTAACVHVDQVALRLLGGPHSPASALDAPVNAGIAQFQQAAQACLHGDFAGMHKLLDDGAGQRAAAQDAIDEILDGDGDAH